MEYGVSTAFFIGLALCSAASQCCSAANIQTSIVADGISGNPTVPINSVVRLTAYARLSSLGENEIGLGGYDLKPRFEVPTNELTVSDVTQPVYGTHSVWPLSTNVNHLTDINGAIALSSTELFQLNLGVGSPADHDLYGIPLFSFSYHAPSEPTNVVLQLVQGDKASASRGFALLENFDNDLSLRPADQWDFVAHSTLAISVVPRQAPIRGDFDNDGQLSARDIDLLSERVRSGRYDGEFDLNDDGRLSGSDRVIWVEDLARTYFGDANLDGEFNSGDFVTVLKSAQYEDGMTKNSGWRQGDWNGDAEFDSGDLVAAFLGGGYEQGRRAAVVPESLPFSLLVVALSVLGAWRRKHQETK